MNEEQGKARILVVDESVLYRRLLIEALAELPEVAQVQAAANAKIAQARLALGPVDLVLFDLECGQEGGLEVIKTIRQTYPGTAVAAMGQPDAGASQAQASKIIRALEMGALDVVIKPSGKAGPDGLREFRRQVSGLLLGMAGRRHASRARQLLASGGLPAPAAPAPGIALPRPRELKTAPAPAEPPRPAPAIVPAGLQVVAIGVSTGGPNALKSVIPRLPRGLGLPVLLVQHMPANFTRALAESLDRYSSLAVREAQAGEPLMPDTVYVAPGGVHMIVRVERGAFGSRLVIGLDDGPPVNSCKPSVDVLMLSLAKQPGLRALTVVMTGMGNDGQAGVEALKRAGGYCLSQSEESCVVYGMPRAVDEAGLSDERVGLENLAERITAVVKQSADKGGQA